MSKTEELKELVSKLYSTHHLEKGEYVSLIENRDTVRDYLFELSGSVREKYYGKDVYIRGLIEFTDYCKNDCYYCGIRCSNKQSATGSARSRYLIAVKQAMNLASERLYCRAEKILITVMI